MPRTITARSAAAARWRGGALDRDAHHGRRPGPPRTTLTLQLAPPAAMMPMLLSTVSNGSGTIAAARSGLSLFCLAYAVPCSRTSCVATSAPAVRRHRFTGSYKHQAWHCRQATPEIHPTRGRFNVEAYSNAMLVAPAAGLRPAGGFCAAKCGSSSARSPSEAPSRVSAPYAVVAHRDAEGAQQALKRQHPGELCDFPAPYRAADCQAQHSHNQEDHSEDGDGHRHGHTTWTRRCWDFSCLWRRWRLRSGVLRGAVDYHAINGTVSSVKMAVQGCTDGCP